MSSKNILAVALVLLASALLADAGELASVSLDCSVGDSLFITSVEPVDSPAAIDAMLDYTSSTYGIRRLYWRGIGDLSRNMRADRTLSPTCSDWLAWLRHLDRACALDAAAVRLAHAHGMEAFCQCGLFELGIQPDARAGYRFEFDIRRYHPEWIATDRWGERREPGTFSYALPEVRAAMTEYFLGLVLRDGFDGINFYTYIEDFGIHYDHEFGFDPAVVQRFNERYPEVDLKQAKLTQEQAEYWYECRGHFVTLFLRELSAALHAAGKKLSVMLDAKVPEYNQPWGSSPIRGNGMIRMDYETWIREGIVDELWVKMAAVQAQRDTLDKLLPLVEGTGTRLTFGVGNPMDMEWEDYRKAGVSPIAGITFIRNGVEAYARGTVTVEGLKSRDWKVRAQTLRAIGKGTVAATPELILPLRADEAVLVRRACCHALAYFAANGHPELVPLIEESLGDRESCVRIAAALALQKASRPESAAALFDAVKMHPLEFQLFFTALDTLKGIGTAGCGVMWTYLDSTNPVLRKLAGLALLRLAGNRMLEAETAERVCAEILRHLTDPDEDILLRLHFIEPVIAMRVIVSEEQVQRLCDAITMLVESDPSWEVQLKAAECCSSLAGRMDEAMRRRLQEALLALFRKYGDGCMRHDAAYGWRDVGNSLVALGCRPALEDFMAQREDAFLAYCAYKVLYDPQVPDAESKKNNGFNLIDEATAVENHRKFAPPFPGNRSW